MTTHFTGSHEHRIDGKGRVSLPADFRHVLDELGSANLLFIVPGISDARALSVLPPEAYSRLIDWHKAQEYPNRAVRQLMTMKILNHVKRVALDHAGRMVIPPAFREQIGATTEVTFIGNNTGFEVWDPSTRTAFEANVIATAADAAPEFDLGSML